MRPAIVVLLLLVVFEARRVEGACSLSVTSVSFGAYDVYAVAPSDSTGTITYRCTGGSDKDIRISISQGSSSMFAPRTLQRGGEALGYNLFRDSAFSQIWGDDTGGTSTYFIHNPPNNKDVVLTVFARIPAGQDVPVGSYSDTVVVTLDY